MNEGFVIYGMSTVLARTEMGCINIKVGWFL